jgi:hypothetical protein
LFGREVQNLEYSRPWAWVSLDVIPDGQGTTAVLAHTAGDTERLFGYVESMRELFEVEEPNKAMFELLIRSADTIVLAPKWWERQSESVQEAVHGMWYLSALGRPMDFRERRRGP